MEFSDLNIEQFFIHTEMSLYGKKQKQKEHKSIIIFAAFNNSNQMGSDQFVERA